MVRRWEWEGNGRGRGVGEGYGVGDSRKLRRLYIFLGDFCVSQFDFVLMSDFFLRGWNVSIGMNALRPHFYMKRGGKKRREKKIGKEDLRFIALSVLICLIPVDDMLLLFFFFSFLSVLMLKNRILVCAIELLLNSRRTGGFGETVRM